jgi:multiple sugar transport system permease protein
MITDGNKTRSKLNGYAWQYHLFGVGRQTRIMLHILAAAFALYIMIPLYWIFLGSTKSNANIINGFGFWFSPPFSLFHNLRELFTYQGDEYGRWILNTVEYAGTGAVLGTAVAAMAAFVLAKHSLRGRRQILAVIFMSFAIPATALVLPLYLLFIKLHLVNNPLGMILPFAGSAFGVLLMYVYVRAAVLDELLEAARLDGASEFGIFWRIGIPLMLPGCASVMLFSVVAIWNNYFLPFVILSKDNLYPVTVGLEVWNSSLSQLGEAHAILYALIVTGGALSIVPTIVLFVVLQRYWRAGLALGAIR